jgi:phospholipase/carboxylesterase|tara:strand:- start:265 stop:933 length:669 start_codon:yes stop_codon:yes gene_type:complete
MIKNFFNYILKFNSILPLSKEKPKQVIVLCHGYGGDGKDISSLAYNWQRFMPDTIFLSPNAPEVCSINPQGYQWFDLTNDNQKIILEKSLIAEEKLSKFLDQVLDNFKLEEKNLALVGFSQGCMMAIQVALKKNKQISCLIGYSGKIINKEHLSNKINSKPKTFLMHGAQDTIVSPTNLLESKEFLTNHGIKTKTKIFDNCEHSIPVEGASLGLAFLKKNLL